MREMVTKVYTFDELSEEAKEKAREWFRNGNLDYEWYDSVYDDAKACAELIGIDIDKIYFSGFSSQGDGACFEGSYHYKKGALKSIKEHAPNDKDLHKIAEKLQNEQKKNFYGISARLKHSGHYYHSGCMHIDTYDFRNVKETDSETMVQLLREFADWIYERLEKEYDFLNSDEIVDESIQNYLFQYVDGMLNTKGIQNAKN